MWLVATILDSTGIEDRGKCKNLLFKKNKKCKMSFSNSRGNTKVRN